MLDRLTALEEVIGRVDDFAVIAGVGSAVFDMARLTENAPNVFPLDGAMGAAVSVGLGLALQREDLHVLVVTGDGELLMNVGSLATVAVCDPGNLSIICVDNERYALTGGQRTHTAFNTDLAMMASAAGIHETLTCRRNEDLALGSAIIRSTSHAGVVVLKVGPESSRPYPVDRDASACRVRFADAVSR